MAKTTHISQKLCLPKLRSPFLFLPSTEYHHTDYNYLFCCLLFVPPLFANGKNQASNWKD